MGETVDEEGEVAFSADRFDRCRAPYVAGDFFAIFGGMRRRALLEGLPNSFRFDADSTNWWLTSEVANPNTINHSALNHPSEVVKTSMTHKDVKIHERHRRYVRPHRTRRF